MSAKEIGKSDSMNNENTDDSRYPTLRIAKKISKISGSTGFYMDVVSVIAMGFLDTDPSGNRTDDRIKVTTEEGTSATVDVRISDRGIFMVLFKRDELAALGLARDDIRILDVQRVKSDKARCRNKTIDE